jgi:hypothetical protein
MPKKYIKPNAVLPKELKDIYFGNINFYLHNLLNEKFDYESTDQKSRIVASHDLQVEGVSDRRALRKSKPTSQISYTRVYL